MTREELKEKYGNEHVLVVENMKLLKWLSVDKDSRSALIKAINCHGFYTYRYDAELDENIRQVIPYVVLKNSDGEIFVTKRIGGDERLLGQLSIGVGGHVDLNVDHTGSFIDGFGDIQRCIIRELKEETTIENFESEVDFDFVEAFIDNSDSVGKVHVCLLTVASNIPKEISIRETDKLAGKWMTPEDLSLEFDKLENWSKIAANILKLNEEKPKKARRKKTKNDQL